MAATPDGRLLVHHGHTVHILDRSMRALQTVATHDDLIAANDEAIFTCCRTTSVRRSTYDGTTVAKFELEGYQLAHGALSPGSLLFSVIWNGEDDQQDEIVALDAQTLQLRHRFGLGLLNGAQHLAVAGDELYVCDNNNDRLHKSSHSPASTAARSRVRGGGHGTFVVQRTASTSSRKNTCAARKKTKTMIPRHRCRAAESLCCRCRATSCRSSRTHQSPRSYSRRSAASTTSCWRANGTFKQGGMQSRSKDYSVSLIK